MSTHTLGPWTVEYDQSTDAAEHVRAEIDGEMYDVASLLCDETGRANANARLIAAAPNMLLCLRNVIDSHGEVDQDLWNRIREVIANATGEAS